MGEPLRRGREVAAIGAGIRLKRPPKAFANRYPDLYETMFCWGMPPETIHSELTAIKQG